LLFLEDAFLLLAAILYDSVAAPDLVAPITRGAIGVPRARAWVPQSTDSDFRLRDASHTRLRDVDAMEDGEIA
jgi:hypothetical protein